MLRLISPGSSSGQVISIAHPHLQGPCHGAAAVCTAQSGSTSRQCPAVAATNNAAAIRTANPTDHQPLSSFRGDAPSFTLRLGIAAVDSDPAPQCACSTAASDLTWGS